MQRAALVIYDEIVYQRTIGGQSLRTHTCWPRQKISQTQFWHITLQRLEERRLTEVPVHLLKANTPVPERHLTEPSIAERLPEITHADIEPTITLACKCQHRIGTQPDITVHAASEMHAQEGKARVRYWIDQPANHSTSPPVQNI